MKETYEELERRIEDIVNDKLNERLKSFSEMSECRDKYSDRVNKLTITILLGFLGVTVWLIVLVFQHNSDVKANYVTKQELTNSIHLPIQLLMAKIDKVSAKTEGDTFKYKEAKDEEEKVMKLIISGTFKQEQTRGIEIKEPK
jgi:hypothetical protein